MQGSEVDAIMRKHNVKDEVTTVTSSYRKFDIPAGSAYSDELTLPTTKEEFLNYQLDIINKLRARHGSPPLQLDDDLTAGAQALAEKNRNGPLVGASDQAGIDYGESYAKV